MLRKRIQSEVKLILTIPLSWTAKIIVKENGFHFKVGKGKSLLGLYMYRHPNTSEKIFSDMVECELQVANANYELRDALNVRVAS